MKLSVIALSLLAATSVHAHLISMTHPTMKRTTWFGLVT